MRGKNEEEARKKGEREKTVITLASYAYTRHHGWYMKATWTKKSVLSMNRCISNCHCARKPPGLI